MKKFLDVLIIVLLAFLLVNLFNSWEKKQENILTLKMTDTSYTIPAGVGIDFMNNTADDISLNTCDDISIKWAWSQIKIEGDFCEDIVVPSWSTYLVDYSEEYRKFDTTWDYVVEFTHGEKDFIQTFSIENKWTFSKLFTALFYAPLYNLLVYLIELFSWSLGWAIISITVFIRLLLVWPQHKMMLSQRKLQAIQPKIRKIQEEFKWNQQMLGMKLMELYKKEKVNPMGSCGFLIIQMPILIVIYNIILSIKNPINEFHLYNFLSGFHISNVNFDFFSIDLLSSWGITGAILALIVASIQFIQIKLSLLSNKKTDTKWIVLEKKAWQDAYSQFMPDPEMMNKFMLYGMPAMVWVFTFTLIAWVGIYWWISTTFMIFQQLIVNKIIKK